jgi:anti-sigma B factor antagonist
MCGSGTHRLVSPGEGICLAMLSITRKTVVSLSSSALLCPAPFYSLSQYAKILDNRLATRSPAHSSVHTISARYRLMSEAGTAAVFALDVVRSGSDVVVRCRGKLVAGVTELFYNDVRQAMPGAKRVVLDLTELTHMDSMGLGTIVRLYAHSKSAGCDFQLINLGPRIRQLLGITNLLTVFTTIGETGITYL